MSQQINLFNPIFLKQKKHFSALTMLQGLALIVLGSIVVVSYARMQLSSLRAEAAATANQLKRTKAQLATVNAEYVPRQASKTLEQSVQRLEAEVKSQQQAFDIVQKGELGDTKGYSEYLRAFSRQSVGGLWLTGFSISGAGSGMELRGRALQPDLVPAYINRLKQEPVMQGKSFSTLSMTVPDTEAAGKNDKSDGVAGTKPRVSAPYIEFKLKSSDGTAQQSDTGNLPQGQSR